MENYGVEVHINGEYLCRAGFDAEFYVLSSILNIMKRTQDKEPGFTLHIGGMNAETSTHSQWKQQTLQAGDKITLEIVQGKFDPAPKGLEKMPEEKQVEQKLKMFNKLKDELKGHLGEEE